jgi:hypothetical protein
LYLVLFLNESAALRASCACALSQVSTSTSAGTEMAIHCSRGFGRRHDASWLRGPRSRRGFLGGTKV